MDMKVYVSCYMPSIKQIFMWILLLCTNRIIIEALDYFLILLGINEKKIPMNLGLELFKF
jgi:hypothetical protein